MEIIGLVEVRFSCRYYLKIESGLRTVWNDHTLEIIELRHPSFHAVGFVLFHFEELFHVLVSGVAEPFIGVALSNLVPAGLGE